MNGSKLASIIFFPDIHLIIDLIPSSLDGMHPIMTARNQRPATPLLSTTSVDARSWDDPPKSRDQKCILHLVIQIHLPCLLQKAWAMNRSTTFTSINTIRNPTCMPRLTHQRPESLPSLHGTPATIGSQRPAFKSASIARQ
ncbi:hypothetical protein ACLOJK_022100 [Asimina triloba]